MGVYSYSRGHEIIYVNGIWIYRDNKKEIDVNRACKKCGRKPTIEGHDYCIKNKKNTKHACCGHGVEKGYAL